MTSKPWLDDRVAANGRAVKDNFQAWFGASVVKDEQGQPLVLYHGSRSPWITQFDLKKKGFGLVNPFGSELEGVWFTSAKSNASFFAESTPKRQARDVMTYGGGSAWFSSIEDSHGVSIFQDGPHPSEALAERAGDFQMAAYNRELRSRQSTFIQSVFVSLTNPLELDGIIPRTEEFAQARARGCDGIIARNVCDGMHDGPADGDGDVHVVFDPRRIKSATRNTGLFVIGSACLSDGPAAEEIRRARLALALASSQPGAARTGSMKPQPQRFSS